MPGWSMYRNGPIVVIAVMQREHAIHLGLAHPSSVAECMSDDPNDILAELRRRVTSAGPEHNPSIPRSSGDNGASSSTGGAPALNAARPGVPMHKTNPAYNAAPKWKLPPKHNAGDRTSPVHSKQSIPPKKVEKAVDS